MDQYVFCLFDTHLTDNGYSHFVSQLDLKTSYALQGGLVTGANLRQHPVDLRGRTKTA
jgi:hypothetical protein